MMSPTIAKAIIDKAQEDLEEATSRIVRRTQETIRAQVVVPFCKKHDVAFKYCQFLDGDVCWNVGEEGRWLSPGNWADVTKEERDVKKILDMRLDGYTIGSGIRDYPDKNGR